MPWNKKACLNLPVRPAMSGRTALVWPAMMWAFVLTPFAMNTLVALDTSTEFLSLAVAVGDSVRSVHQHVGQQHAELTLPTLSRLLQEQGIGLDAVDAIAFGNGPGAFTGLRVACGAAQGLAVAADVPLIPVCSLDQKGIINISGTNLNFAILIDRLSGNNRVSGQDLMNYG